MSTDIKHQYRAHSNNDATKTPMILNIHTHLATCYSNSIFAICTKQIPVFGHYSDNVSSHYTSHFYTLHNPYHHTSRFHTLHIQAILEDWFLHRQTCFHCLKTSSSITDRLYNMDGHIWQHRCHVCQELVYSSNIRSLVCLKSISYMQLDLAWCISSSWGNL